MLNRQQRFGKESETVAAEHLARNGYTILERNYHTPYGEIDIIAKDGDALVFVEVKARRSDHFGSPKWAITPEKQRKISMVALSYLKAANQSHAKARFDVVAIISPPYTERCRNQASVGHMGTRDRDEEMTRMEIIKNAFELAYP